MSRDCVLSGVSYTPLGHPAPTLRDCTCRIRAGAWTVVAGRTGSGKSTLLLAAAGILAREGAGRLRGDVTDLERIGGAGIVFQRPDDAFCCETAAEEVAFQLENAAMDPAEIRARVGDALAAVGLGAFAERNVLHLSGGQKQRVALACALAVRARWLILDEPCSALDPAATQEFLALVDRVRRERNFSIVQAEHRLDTVMPYADELLVLDDGRLAWSGDFADACVRGDVLRAHGLEVPGLAALCHEQGIAAAPRTPDAARAVLDTAALRPPRVHREPIAPGAPILRVEHVSAGYHRRGPSVVRDISWQVRSGERWAVLGPNGAGKSTLLHAIAGLAVVHGGSIAFPEAPAHTACGLVLQDAVLMLTEPSVGEEVRLGFRDRPAGDAVQRWLEAIGLDDRAEEPPLSLSHGERVRLALAAVAAPEPQLLLLDEPTTGQDRAHLDRLVDLLRPGNAPGAIAFCTHDWETAVSLATHALVLRDGEVVFTGGMAAALQAAARGQFCDLPLPDALALRLEGSSPRA